MSGRPKRRAQGLLALLALLAPLAATGSAHAAPVVVVDDRGRSLTFETPPARIVSLLPSITESVCALGACERLVGTDRYSNAPASVASLPKLGGLDDVQVEMLVALRPDVVLAARSARTTERLESLGLRVLLVDSETHADVHRSLLLIARLLGDPASATRLWTSIERRLAVAAARVPPHWRGRSVYFEIASAPYAAGAASFIGETLDLLGLTNVVPAALGPFPKLNPEFVVRSRPDLVMASRPELLGMAGRPGWSGLTALSNGHSCGFEPARFEILIRPGPRLGEAAEAIADCLAALPTEVAASPASGAGPQPASSPFR